MKISITLVNIFCYKYFCQLSIFNFRGMVKSCDREDKSLIFNIYQLLICGNEENYGNC